MQEFYDLNRFVAQAGPYRLEGFSTLNGRDFFRRSVEEIEQNVDVSSNTPLPYTRVETVYHLVSELQRWLLRTDIGITLADTITTGYLDLMTYLSVRAWYFYNFDILWRNLFAICMGESRRIRYEILDLEDATLREELLNSSHRYFVRLEAIYFPTDGYNSDSTDNPFYLHQDSPGCYERYRHDLRRNASRQLLMLIQWLQSTGHRQLYEDFHDWMEDAFFYGMSPIRPMIRFCAEDVLVCRMPFEMAALDLPDGDHHFDMGWLEPDTFDYLQFLSGAPACSARNVRHHGWLPPDPLPDL